MQSIKCTETPNRKIKFTYQRLKLLHGIYLIFYTWTRHYFGQYKAECKLSLVYLFIKSKTNLYLYINLACLGVYLFVCLYPMNVKTAEPTKSKIFEATHITSGKVYCWLTIKNVEIYYFWKCTKSNRKIHDILRTIENGNFQSLRFC